MAVLSIQSSVAAGHVGNSAAVFALQRLGREVWPVHTVQLSAHTAHGTPGGGALGAEHVRDVLAGLERHPGFANVDAVLTGYLGDPEVAAAAAETVDRVKAARPDALYCCDPVMGNAARGLYVAPETADAIAADLLPRADIATPNVFELARLASAPAATVDEARAACPRLAARGPATVVATSLATGVGTGALAWRADGAWIVETPRLPAPGNGAGDVMAALLLGHLLGGAALDEAVARAVSSTFGLLEAGGRGEIALVAAQHELAAPRRRFAARRLAPEAGQPAA